ncbi:protein kinase [Massilia sp. R2A-15]|uniref:serine/threonine protein kinase n=1 Tax=Massilia sp. R2A-15 TaxID=3064278 RepID=UPI00273389D7|nr:protein kinase [Massilia sp. R2A-15]WLI90912.1 protein kinase [Massilia sp. R2A-15]
MTRHLHEPANAVLYRALDLPPADRQQFIADACAGEPDLLALVRELLARIEQLDEFLEAPLEMVEAREDDGPAPPRPDPDVAPEAARPVAVQPFFAGERGDGVPIDRYCASMKLDLHQRVALFAKACRAMHHAHQHLVMHRNLKPDNILVKPDGEVMLADVADAGDAGAWTVAPLFASPEQLAGLPLTTSADVYSLGAVLYGLVSGRSPNAAEAAGIIHARPRAAPVRASDAVAQAAERHYPPLPELAPDELLKPDAKLAAQLRGDIDDILLKALDPEPARRYASADALAGDLDRFLAREPVEASPAGVERRRVQNKRFPFVTAAAVALLVAVAGAAVWHAMESDKARAKAEGLVATALSDAARNIPAAAAPAATAAAQAEPQDGLPALRKELAMREMIAAKDAGSAQDALGVADAHTAIGNALIAATDYPAAEAEYAAARKTYAAQAQANPADAALKAGLMEIDLARAHVQNLQHHGRDAVQTLAGLHKLEGGARDARVSLLEAHIQPRGTAAQAFAAAEPALAELLTQYEAEPRDVAKLRKSAQAWQSTAEVALRANQTAAACGYLGLAAKRYEEFAASNNLNATDKWRQSQVQELRKACN